jgi:hypothetical protein
VLGAIRQERRLSKDRSNAMPLQSVIITSEGVGWSIFSVILGVCEMTFLVLRVKLIPVF